MPKIQNQKGSLVTSIPKDIIKVLGLEKGDSINFNVSIDGQVGIVKIKEELK